MLRILALLLCAATTAAAGSLTAGAAPSGSFTLAGTVSYVVDGDTLDIRAAGGRSERVRLIGIDTPERGACHAAAATREARRLALGKPVVLSGDATQATRDRYGRLLAYVALPGGKDLGQGLVRGGFGRVYVYGGKPFARVGAYRSAETAARSARAGLWGACGGAPASAAGSCHPSYSPCLPIVADLDCADVRALGKAPVRVKGSDPYRLDGDGDGWGCE